MEKDVGGEVDVSSVLNEEQLAEIRKAFNVCDEDGSGTIEREELASVMKELGENPTEEELEDLLKDMDADGDGTISWEEFLKVMTDWIVEAGLDDSADDSDSDEEE
jgi:Ca2+-binding EF-hand superfamily protein